MVSAVLQKEIIINSAGRKAVGIIFFAACMFFSACVRIPLPFTPVPLTLQTFFVLLSGACLGPAGGMASQALYLGAGMAGMPVFTNAGSGSLYFFGPTAGYLWGFLAASWLIGMLSGRMRTFRQAFFMFACIDLCILLCGAAWLKTISGEPFSRVMLIGFLPFVPGNMLKVYGASVVYWNLKGRCRQLFKA